MLIFARLGKKTTESCTNGGVKIAPVLDSAAAVFQRRIAPTAWRTSHLRMPVLSTVILATVFFVTLSAHAQSTYHVRAGASGSQNGSDWNNAYPSLPASLVRGAIYYIADGNYGSYTFDDANSGSLHTTIKKATATDHGSDTGWQSSYGDGQATFAGKIEFTTSYWVFDGAIGGGPENKWNQNLGFKITEAGDANAVVRIGYSRAVSNITIRHVDMQGKGSVSTQGGAYSNDGIAIYNSSSNVTLSYAWLHGIGRCPVFITGAKFTLFEYLYVSSYYGSSSVHSEVMSSGQGAMDDMTWRYSLITDIKATGGLMWDNNSNPSCHLYIYGNIFYKPAGAKWDVANGVIGGWTGGNGEEFRNVHVYNNTFINIDQQSLSTFPNVYSGNVAYNNLFYNCQSPNFAKFGTHDYNHFINSGGAHSEAHGTTAASGDPFVDYVNLDFRLQAATTTGTALPSPYHIDAMGTVRGSGGTWDRGAFQFGGSSLTAPPNLRILTVQ